MKKTKLFFALILIFTLTLTIFPNDTFASTMTEIIYQDDNFIVTSTITSHDSLPNVQLFSASKTKKGSKTINIHDAKGNTIATYILYAAFTYNGKSATCTNASCSTSIKKNGWSFTSKTVTKSGNSAIGSYAIKNSSTNKTQSSSIRLTCNKSGQIS